FRQRVTWLFRELDERAVGQGVAADQLCGIRCVVILAEERDFDLGRILDDVVVCEDETLLADDEAGARCHRCLFARRTPVASAAAAALASSALRRSVLFVGIAAARLAKEAAEQVVVAAPASSAPEELGQVLVPRLRF